MRSGQPAGGLAALAEPSGLAVGAGVACVAGAARDAGTRLDLADVVDPRGRPVGGVDGHEAALADAPEVAVFAAVGGADFVALPCACAVGVAELGCDAHRAVLLAGRV